ncbi:hypothetical protein AVEN_257546-1 [Araneus ventricosus]|uniref:Uncharacterized protein n=1 Tax=Araneus ventricosus TaxID=182803 RepID=A0A4Y2L222_ARAVE|nr:hypothetical protein AVEN_257546-1 [Araneus ventricosus]
MHLFAANVSRLSFRILTYSNYAHGRFILVRIPPDTQRQLARLGYGACEIIFLYDSCFPYSSIWFSRCHGLRHRDMGRRSERLLPNPDDYLLLHCISTYLNVLYKVAMKQSEVLELDCKISVLSNRNKFALHTFTITHALRTLILICRTRSVMRFCKVVDYQLSLIENQILRLPRSQTSEGVRSGESSSQLQGNTHLISVLLHKVIAENAESMITCDKVLRLAWIQWNAASYASLY